MLTDILARDVMTTSPVTLHADDPIDEAIRTLDDNEMSGAPVQDAAGRIIGVLSIRDIARSEHVSGSRIEAREQGRVDLADLRSADGQIEGEEEERRSLRQEGYGQDAFRPPVVADWMNPEVVSVESEDPLPAICAVMARAKVHRVLVIDDGKLRGIVSSMDVIRAVAEAP